MILLIFLDVELIIHLFLGIILIIIKILLIVIVDKEEIIVIVIVIVKLNFIVLFSF